MDKLFKLRKEDDQKKLTSLIEMDLVVAEAYTKRGSKPFEGIDGRIRSPPNKHKIKSDYNQKKVTQDYQRAHRKLEK